MSGGWEEIQLTNTSFQLFVSVIWILCLLYPAISIFKKFTLFRCISQALHNMTDYKKHEDMTAQVTAQGQHYCWRFHQGVTLSTSSESHHSSQTSVDKMKNQQEREINEPFCQHMQGKVPPLFCIEAKWFLFYVRKTG